ncbi:MAG: nuclear transport factor 2 family protein [Reyranella sp.]
MTHSDETQSFAIPGAIAETLQRYIDGARTGDIVLLRSAFAEGARVSGSYGGKPVTWNLGEFCDAVAKGGPAPALQARIVGIDTAGGAAMARLEALDWRGTRYTDFFVMVRRDDGWRIDSKVFHAHSRA